MKKRNKIHGFTMIELIIVIAIVAILATVALASYISVQEKGKAAVDDSNTALLTQLTATYATMNDIEMGDVFDGLSSDAERLDLLYDSSLLESIPDPAQDGMTYSWNQTDLKWETSGS